jgi:hypothetical protein
MFRPSTDAFWAAPVRQVTGALTAAQQGVQGCVNGVAQGCVEAVHCVKATGRAAVGGVQRAGTMLVTPVQQAVQRMVSYGACRATVHCTSGWVCMQELARCMPGMA